MSEPESKPPPKKLDAELLKWFLAIQRVADTQVAESDVADTRALEGQENLVSAGETWLRQEIRHTKQLHYVRVFLLGALFLLVLLWLLSVALLLILQGFKLWGFWLSDKVIIAYITSTTVSVLGLFHIAAKWLFSAGFADFARSLKELTGKGSAKT